VVVGFRFDIDVKWCVTQPQPDVLHIRRASLLLLLADSSNLIWEIVLFSKVRMSERAIFFNDEVLRDYYTLEHSSTSMNYGLLPPFSHSLKVSHFYYKVFT